MWSATPFVETTEFLDIEELISDQGDIAVIIEEHPDTPGQYFISTYQPLQSDLPTEQDISNSYLSACNIPDSDFDFDQFNYLLVPDPPLANPSSDLTSTAPTFDTPIYTLRLSESTTNQSEVQASTFITRKYKPVAKKVHAVLANLPDIYRITCNIDGNPLTEIPNLTTNPPEFKPTGRYTAKRRDIINKVHPEGCLLPDERKLMHHFTSEQNEGFTWDERLIPLI